MTAASRILVSAAMLLALPATAQSFAHAPHQEQPRQRPAGVVPFEQAEASRMADGRAVVRWRAAAAAGTVAAYAGTDSTAVDRSRPIGSGAAAGAILTARLPGDARWFVELVPEHGAALVIADRSVGLATAPNLRDVGGYRTSDGRWVRMGAVYRSDQLDRLSDGDLARLGRLGIGLVADLRTDAERAREPDRLPAGATPIVLDVMASAAGSVGGDMRGAMQRIVQGEGERLLVEANRDFVSAPSALRAYRELFARLATGNGAMLYHCTAGKDRTGWATAVLLTLLGVPRETVFADYLASNGYLAGKNAAILARLGARPGDPERAQLEPVLTVRAEYLQAAFAEVEARYGTFERYRREALGIDDATVARLRHKLLVGSARGVR